MPATDLGTAELTLTGRITTASNATFCSFRPAYSIPANDPGVLAVEARNYAGWNSG